MESDLVTAILITGGQGHSAITLSSNAPSQETFHWELSKI